MNKKILIIEDEPTLQKTLGISLADHGYEVKSALDGELGLAAAREQKPDIILLDIILPKKDGYEVLEELKNDETTKNIPVIILTNLEGPQDIQRALDMGATTYLVKANYDLKEVIEKIQDIIK